MKHLLKSFKHACLIKTLKSLEISYHAQKKNQKTASKKKKWQKIDS